MSIIDDPDFLTTPTKQLSAARELANPRERLVDLQSKLLNRMHERIRRLEIEIERDRLSIDVAIAGAAERGTDLTAHRGAA